MGFFLNQKDIRVLRERVDELETGMRKLDLEWSSTYDKFRSILARIAKREERLRAAVEADSSAGFQEAGPDGPVSSLPTDPISQRILARRNRLTRGQPQ